MDIHTFCHFINNLYITFRHTYIYIHLPFLPWAGLHKMDNSFTVLLKEGLGAATDIYIYIPKTLTFKSLHIFRWHFSSSGTHTHTHICACMHTHICTHTHTNTQACTYMRAHTHTRTHAYKHMHTHTHTHCRAISSLSSGVPILFHQWKWMRLRANHMDSTNHDSKISMLAVFVETQPQMSTFFPSPTAE